MTAGYPLPRNLDGSLALPGRARKRLEANFGFGDGTVLPSWLTATSTGSRGTAVISDAATTGRGEMVLTTGNVANDQSRVSGPLIDISKSKVGAVFISVDGLSATGGVANVGSTFPPILRLGLYNTSGGNRGAYVIRQSDGTHDVAIPGATSVDVPDEYTTFLANRTTSQSLGLLILPRRKLVYMMEGDQEIVGIDAGTSPLLGVGGTVIPRLEIETVDTSVKTVSVSKLSIELWTY